MVPAAELMTEAMAFATRLAAGPTRSFVLTRALVDAAATATFDHLLDLEAEVQQEAGSTEDHKVAVAAFLAKQPPQFKGK